MPRIPEDVIQVAPYPLSLTHRAGCRSVSDDDLCAWCSHLLYRPGELSLCQLSLPEGHWPSRCDEGGYAQSCPQLHLNVPPADITCR